MQLALGWGGWGTTKQNKMSGTRLGSLGWHRLAGESAPCCPHAALAPQLGDTPRSQRFLEAVEGEVASLYKGQAPAAEGGSGLKASAQTPGSSVGGRDRSSHELPAESTRGEGLRGAEGPAGIKVLDSLNKEFLDDPKYSTDEDLPEKLEAFKKKYMEFDLNGNGDIDIMALKRMLEKLGAAKTHLELKKMITEVTGGLGETIGYRDFVHMMLGKRSAIFKLILMYEDKAKEKEEKPAGPPAKRAIADLP
ncbi:unnamed protein product [Eretmochelys imbricata]